jgi:hypothetical protein
MWQGTEGDSVRIGAAKNLKIEDSALSRTPGLRTWELYNHVSEKQMGTAERRSK